MSFERPVWTGLQLVPVDRFEYFRFHIRTFLVHVFRELFHNKLRRVGMIERTFLFVKTYISALQYLLE